jgi:hypothetical protein
VDIALSSSDWSDSQRILPTLRPTNLLVGLRSVSAPVASPLLALSEKLRAKETLGTHDMEDEHPAPFLPIEDPAGRFHDLAIAPSLELRRSGSATWVVFELIDVFEDSLN